MSRIGWYCVPPHLTMTGTEAKKCYKRFDPNDVKYWVLSYDHTTTDDVPRDSGGMTDCYIMRGAAKVVKDKYAWDNSGTDGGYVEHLVNRLLDSRYGTDTDYSDEKLRHEYAAAIDELLRRVKKKYYLAPTTDRAVRKHLYNELLGLWCG